METIAEKIRGKTLREKANIKATEIAKLDLRGKFIKGEFEIEIASRIRKIDGGIEFYARAWKNGKSVGLGKSKKIETEKFRIFNPDFEVPDGTKRDAEIELPSGKKIKYKQDNYKEDLEEATKKTLYEMILDTHDPEAKVKVGSIGNTTTVIYPDAGDSTGGTVDGDVAYESSDSLSWASIIGQGGNQTRPTIAVGAPFYIHARTTANTWQDLYRAIFNFDLTVLGSDDIDSIIFSFYGTLKADNLSCSPSLNIYSANPASDDALVAGDFDSLGSTPYSSAIAYADLNASGYNNWTLNATGLAAAASALAGSGILKIGTREATYDVGATEPNFVANQESYITCYFADQGSNKPKLTIVSSPPVTTTDITKDLDYAVITNTDVTKGLEYKVVAPAEITKGLAYTIVAPVATTKTLEYRVATPQEITKDLDYAVITENDISKGLEYAVIAPVEITKDLDYAIKSPVEITKDLDYTIIAPVEITKGLEYMILTDSEITKDLDYEVVKWYQPAKLTLTVGSIVDGILSNVYEQNGVLLELAEVNGANPAFVYDFDFYGIVQDVSYVAHFHARYTGSPSHRIKLQQYNFTDLDWENLTVNVSDFPYNADIQTYAYEIESGADYVNSGNIRLRICHCFGTGDSAHEFVIDQFILEYRNEITRSMQYKVVAPVEITKGLQYTVITDSEITKDLNYSIVTETDINKTLEYKIKAPVDITKGLQYTIIAPSEITKGLTYGIVTEKEITKTLRYAVAVPHEITKSAQYTVKSQQEASLGLRYEIVSPKSITKGMTYRIIIEMGIEKGLDYMVKAPIEITKGLEYRVETSVEITKGLEYQIIIIIPHDITKGLEYRVETSSEILKTLSYEVKMYPYSQKESLYSKKTSPYSNKTGIYTPFPVA